MNYIRPCPSCNVDLRFPLDRGILTVKCPNCNFRFEIDPDSSELFQIGHIEKNSTFPLSSFRFPNVIIKQIIPFLLFCILGIYILRTCSLEYDIATPETESDQLNIPLNPKPNLLPDEEEKEKNIPKPFPSPGTSI